ncbi:MAG: hypothetical protein KDK33_02110 [Leptospiraceae bacterium]|nr:hypothetical protein [Leptospiraceae bacterium]
MSFFLAKLQKNIFLLSVVAGVFLGAALAYALYIILSAMLMPSPEAAMNKLRQQSPQQVIKPPPTLPFEEYEALVSGNLFRDTPVVKGEEGIELAEIKQFTLMGVLAGSPEFANAAIQLEGESEPNEYYLNEEVGGSKIVRIFADGIEIQRGDARLRVLIGETTGDAQSRQQAQNNPVEADPNAQKIAVQRSKIKEAANNQALMMQKNNFAAIFRDNKIVGLRMTKVEPQGNLLYDMGARVGDIIKRINGRPLENQEKMYEIWQSIKTADQFTVDLERVGKNLSYQIIVQN